MCLARHIVNLFYLVTVKQNKQSKSQNILTKNLGRETNDLIKYKNITSETYLCVIYITLCWKSCLVR